jgi:hypothetical protein
MAAHTPPSATTARNQVGIAIIGEAGGKLMEDSGPFLDFPKQQTTKVAIS